MNKTRTWIAGAIAAVLVIVIGGYMVGISPILGQISAASAQKTTIDQSNAVSQSKLASLKVQFASIGKLKKKLTSLRESVPEEDGASSFLDELTALSSSYGVTLTSLSLASATIYADPNAAAAATPAPAADGSTAAPTTTTTTSSGLILIPVNLSVSGSFDAVKGFIGAAQTGARLFFISSVSIGGSSDSATASVDGDVFSQQGTSDPVKKPASPTTSTATPTPTATATLTPTPNPTATTTTSGSTKTGGTSNPVPTTPPVQPTTPPSSDPTTDPDSTS
jgi:Tfp pilus assembly protein PilO